MKYLLLQLILPPIIFFMPWLLPAWHRQWDKTGLLFILWCGCLGVLLFKWAGVGLLLFMTLGALTLLTARVQLRVR